MVLPANNAPSGAKLNVALSTVPGPQDPQIPAGSPQAFLYLAMTPTSDVTLNGSPKVTMTLPQAPKSQGQFYAWLYDTSAKTWLDLAPVSVQGAQMVFGGTDKTLALKQGTQYLVIPFTATQFASCPTPVPSPTPTTTPPPPAISGKFYVTAASVASSGPFPGQFANAELLTYNEATGAQMTALPLQYPAGAYAQAMTLSKDFSKLYIAAYGPLDNGGFSTFPLPGLTIVDTSTNTIAHQTMINGGIFSGALSPDGSRYYGAGQNQGSSALFVFDTSNGALLDTIPLPTAAGGTELSVAATATTVFVGSGNANTIYAVNPSTNAVSTFYTSTCGCSPTFGIDAAGTQLFLNELSDVRTLSTATGSSLSTINPPGGIASFIVGSSESADDSTIVFQDRYSALGPTGLDQYGAGVLSTSNNSWTGQFHLTIPATAVSVNANGSFALFSQNSNSGFQNVDARALPMGQLYYSITPPNGLLPTAEAAQ